MRRLLVLTVAAATLAAAVPAAAQVITRDGPRVTVTPRAVVTPARPAQSYALDPVFAAPWEASYYEGVTGFQRYPLPDPLYVPGQRGLKIDFRAPDALMR